MENRPLAKVYTFTECYKNQARYKNMWLYKNIVIYKVKKVFTGGLK